MTHLSGGEFVDFLDGTLPASRLAHVRACSACHGQAEAARLALAEAAADSAPDPSPLFWEHFSARVRTAIDAPPVRTWRDRLPRPAVAWAAGLTSAALAVALAHSAGPKAVYAPAGPSLPVLTRPQADAPPSRSADLTVEDAGSDSDWALVQSMADGVDWDAAQSAGISTRQGGADRLALEMTGREQTELVRLLENELKRKGGD